VQRKLIEKAIEESENKIKEALKEQPVETTYKIVYGCNSENSVRFDIVATSNHFLFDEPIDSIVFSDECVNAYRRGVVKKVCCQCIYE
jgi:hypothetical protein